MSILSWTDVTARYAELGKLPDAASPEVQNRLMSMAEGAVYGRLNGMFSTPFSSDNLTAIDLMVDTLYLQTQRTRQPDKCKLLEASLKDRFDSILSGASTMVTTDGAVAGTLVGNTVWSNTMNYPPVFGASDIENAQVSSQQLYDERVSRGNYAL